VREYMYGVDVKNAHENTQIKYKKDYKLLYKIRAFAILNNINNIATLAKLRANYIELCQIVSSVVGHDVKLHPHLIIIIIIIIITIALHYITVLLLFL